jgi:hypothetical protein
MYISVEFTVGGGGLETLGNHNYIINHITYIGRVLCHAFENVATMDVAIEHKI